MSNKRIQESGVFLPQDFFSRGQAAEILGVTHATITRSIHAGYLPTVTIGGHEFVLRETRESVVAERKVASQLGIGKGD